MSGTPKYCQAEVQARQRAELERERKRQAAEEERRRLEAEARERQKQFAEARKKVEQECEALRSVLAQQKLRMHAADKVTLEQAAVEISASVARATTLANLNRVTEKVATIVTKIHRAVALKHHDDEVQRLHRELDKLNAQNVQLQQILDFQREDGMKFDGEGRKAATAAIKRAADAVAASQLQNARDATGLATKAVASHQEAVVRRRAEHDRKRREAEAAVGELEAVIVGLRSDPVVLRWQERAVNDLATEVQQVRSAVASEHFDIPVGALVRVRSEVAKLVSASNEAQLKADQRDYIARSIVDALKAMSFEVAAPVYTHPDPLSPLEVHAADSLDRHLYISIPVEGNMMYTVDGFPMSAAIAADGSETSACDVAEQVLLDMQNRLDTAAGISTGEIWWEGKDPNRNLQTAKPLDYPRRADRERR